jgi:protein ImuA
MSLPAASIVAALRRKLASLEATASPSRHARQAPRDDGALGFCAGAAVSRGALHEVAARRESELAHATGFILALAAHAAGERATLWIAEDMAVAENGALYGPALDNFGLAPERLVTVTVPRCRDVLWAMEEALRCRSVGAVIGEVRSVNRNIGLTATRRLSLAAGRHGACALLMRASPGIESSAASTRWIVGAAPSALRARGVGPPAIHVRLVRNRRGNLGSWMLEWNCADQRFNIMSADREPLAEADRNRSHRAAARS